MDSEKIIKRIINKRIVVILRGLDTEQAIKVTSLLTETGVKNIEITLDSPNALETIEILSNKYLTSKDVLIGAGTVINSDNAIDSIKAGAKYLISPIFDKKVLIESRKNDILYIPGVLTPTEIINAFNHGVNMVKIFPAGNMGYEYIKSLKGPLKDIKIMATGKINNENAVEYLTNGADCLGIGSSIIDEEALEKMDYEIIKKKAQNLINKIENYERKKSDGIYK